MWSAVRQWSHASPERLGDLQLEAIIAKHFFAGVNETTSFIFALLAFAAGFAVRPFGAIVFGRLGDMIGRKHTFLITIVIMGLSTAVVGLLPSYAAIGVEHLLVAPQDRNVDDWGKVTEGVGALVA